MIGTKNLKTTSGQEYLDKDFSVELNFKLWVTKGSRFVASSRLKKVNKLSAYSVGLLSAYVIIVGLLSVIKINSRVIIASDLFAFTSTGLSIVILVFSQLESASEYRLRAEKYHDCALEISELYDKLRFIKTSGKTTQEINDLAQSLSIDYAQVLKKYENHEPIDFKLFQTTKNDYFKLSDIKIAATNIQYYCKTHLLYHTLIFVPPILIYLFAR